MSIKIESSGIDSNKLNILSGSSIKIIALVTMLFDHLGQILLKNGIALNAPYQMFSDQEYSFLLNMIDCCHMVGRVAFPLFCYLLVEGFLHTHSLKKYICHLGLFALISEPIYDLAFYGRIFCLKEQNVMLTLLLGLLTLLLIQKCNNKIICAIPLALFSGGISYILKLDGWYYGIALITVFYLFHNSSYLKYVLAVIVMYICGLDFSLKTLIDPYFVISIISLFIIMLYNGKRGIKMKYFFYIFYPAHLLFIYIISTYCVVPLLEK